MPLLSVLKGYALLVWVHINYAIGRSSAGANVLSLVVGVGGAIIELTLVIAGPPIGVTLLGLSSSPAPRAPPP